MFVCGVCKEIWIALFSILDASLVLMVWLGDGVHFEVFDDVRIGVGSIMGFEVFDTNPCWV